MNTKIFYIRMLFFGLLFMTKGCTEDYLEQKPDNRMSLNSLDQLAKTLVDAYPKCSYGFTEWMSDNTAYTPNATTQSDFPRYIYEWKECLFEDQDSPVWYWTQSYHTIAQANLVLNTIKNIKGGDPEYRKAIIGEALLCRAYAYFMLVNLFAKPYDKDTAKNDLGIPYVTQLENQLLTSYKRNTVQEVYDLVEKDLLEGLKLVSSKYYKNSGKFHFTKKSALAFASRFYLWKGEEEENYKKAEEYADQLLSMGNGESQWVRDYHADVIGSAGTWDALELNYCKVSLPANLLFATQKTLYTGEELWHSGYGITEAIKHEIFYFDYPFGLRALSGMQKTGAHQFAKFRKQYKGDIRQTELLFTGEEVVYNRAEARLMQGDIDGAESDLILILGERYFDKDGSITRIRGKTPGLMMLMVFKKLKKKKIKGLSEKEVLLQIIIDDRRREFILSGLRWFDIRRFHLPVTHQLRDGTTDTLTEDDPRKVLPIPSAAIKVGLKPNPGKQKKVSSKINEIIYPTKINKILKN